VVSDYDLNKVLFTIAGQHRMMESLSDAELAGHDLNPEEVEALKKGDTGRLYELGANPYLIRRVFRQRFAL
jgi:hypothetical protein